MPHITDVQGDIHYLLSAYKKYHDVPPVGLGCEVERVSRYDDLQSEKEN